MLVLAGSSHPAFLDRLLEYLSLPKSEVVIGKFANGEINVDIEVSVRDRDVYIVQTGHEDVNDQMMELMIMIHACKISSARRVTAVLPYFPYSKQTSLPEADRKDVNGFNLGPRRRSVPKLSAQFGSLTMDSMPASPVAESPAIEYATWPVQTSTLIASMLMTAGADHFITMDLHDPQFQGFFDVPLENLPSLPVMSKCIRNLALNAANSILVSPDAGGAKRTAQLAEALGFDFALVHQDRRTGSTSDVNILIGSVQDKVAVLVDDIADTCETLINAAELCHQKGAQRVLAIITHGILSGQARERLFRSCIDTVFISNTIPQDASIAMNSASVKKFEVFDVSVMFGEAIRRLHNGESFTCLYKPSAFM